MTQPRPTVAVACAGVGVVNRGFERQASDLASVLSREFEVVLLGGGAGAGLARHIPTIPRTSRLSRLLPRATKFWSNDFDRALWLELATFTASTIVRLLMTRVDVVICMEPFVARNLTKVRNRTRLANYVTIYIDGLGGHAQDAVGIADIVQVMTEERAEELVAAGHSRADCIVLPYGYFPERFRRRQAKLEARARWNLPTSATVALSVAAINSRHKRADYLIQEFANGPEDMHLVLCGNVEEPHLLEVGHQLMGDRLHHLAVGFNDIPDVLAAADVFVHASLIEGFGLAPLEAAAAELPVMAHDSEHFRWLLGESGHFVDMAHRGALASAIRTDMSPSLRPEPDPFDWDVLLLEYTRTLEKLCRRRRHRP